MAALLAAALANTSSGTNVPVAVYPSDESHAANPATQISFRGVHPAALTGIEVTGSKTGHHDGVLKAHSDQMGASFIPKKRFKPGETVTVTADPDLVGADGDNEIKFETFRYPRRDRAKLVGKTHDPGGVPPEDQFFNSEPNLHPPSIEVRRKAKGVENGSVFLGVKAGKGQDGPMITNDDGKLIWFKALPKDRSAFDFRMQKYQHKDVLTWWQGLVLKGEGFGEGVILDDHYHEIARVNTGNGYTSDLHEFVITKRDTALLIAYHPIYANLKHIPDAPDDAAALDTIVQEVDVKTGLVMFEWHAFDHIRQRDGYAPYRKHKAYDFAHVNAVHEEDNGDLLISARNPSAILEVDRLTGNTAFRIGGKRPTLPMLPQAFFVAQHSVGRTKRGAITLFDNGAGAPPRNGVARGRPSRGLVLRQPKPPPGVPPGAVPPAPIFVEQELKPDEPRFTYSQGSVQELENGNFFVGWGGDQPWFSEFSSNGQLVYDARMLPKSLDTYRAFRFEWRAHPDYPPQIVVEGSRAYVSWNGATQVRKWQLLGGSDPNDLKPIGDAVPKHGFEQPLDVPGAPAYVAVRGVDTNGTTLGTSKLVRLTGG